MIGVKNLFELRVSNLNSAGLRLHPIAERNVLARCLLDASGYLDPRPLFVLRQPIERASVEPVKREGLRPERESPDGDEPQGEKQVMSWRASRSGSPGPEIRIAIRREARDFSLSGW